jgi:hypothetical protein
MPPDPKVQSPQPESAPTKDEFHAAYQQAMPIVLGFTKSKPRTEELMQAAAVLLMSTRRWDRSKGPLLDHFVSIVRSVLSHAYSREKTERGERAAETREKFQREVVGTEAPSPEEKTLDGADAANRQAAASRELDALEASLAVAGSEDAVRVLRARRAADGKKRAGDIAKELEIPAERVYRANKLILQHARKLRARRAENAPDERAERAADRKADDSEVDS